MVKSKETRLLNRREFGGLCVALSSFVILPSAWGADAATDVASTGAGRSVRFRDGTLVPALGQGSAGLGKGRHPQADEEEALRTGLSLGMTLIDTAEIYGSEEFIGIGFLVLGAAQYDVGLEQPDEVRCIRLGETRVSGTPAYFNPYVFPSTHPSFCSPRTKSVTFFALRLR